MEKTKLDHIRLLSELVEEYDLDELVITKYINLLYDTNGKEIQPD